MPTVWKEVEVEIDITLDDFDTDELMEELSARKQRGVHGSSFMSDLQSIYELRCLGQDYQRRLDTLFYDYLGRIS